MCKASNLPHTGLAPKVSLEPRADTLNQKFFPPICPKNRSEQKSSTQPRAPYGLRETDKAQNVGTGSLLYEEYPAVDHHWAGGFTPKIEARGRRAQKAAFVGLGEEGRIPVLYRCRLRLKAPFSTFSC